MKIYQGSTTWIESIRVYTHPPPTTVYTVVCRSNGLSDGDCRLLQFHHHFPPCSKIPCYVLLWLWRGERARERERGSLYSSTLIDPIEMVEKRHKLTITYVIILYSSDAATENEDSSREWKDSWSSGDARVDCNHQNSRWSSRWGLDHHPPANEDDDDDDDDHVKIDPERERQRDASEEETTTASRRLIIASRTTGGRENLDSIFFFPPFLPKIFLLNFIIKCLPLLTEASTAAALQPESCTACTQL